MRADVEGPRGAGRRTAEPDTLGRRTADPTDGGDDAVVDWLGGARVRTLCDVEATVVEVRPSDGATVSLDVVVEDSTGRLLCHFFGRRQIEGLTPGRGIRVQGRVVLFAGRRCLLNPSYELLGPPTASAVNS